MRRSIIVLACLVVAACAESKVPLIQTVSVDRPVPVACVPADMPSAPAYPDTPDALFAAKGANARYQLLTEGYALRAARLNLLEGVVANCRAVPTAH